MCRSRSCWLYSLMARLLKPLTGDVASSMRQLYRVCCQLRHTLVEVFVSASEEAKLMNGSKSGPLEQGAVKEENIIYSELTEDEFEKQLALLNTIIVITGLYFGQGEDFAQLSER